MKNTLKAVAITAFVGVIILCGYIGQKSRDYYTLKLVKENLVTPFQSEPVGMVAISQDNLGFSVSSTVVTVSTSTPTQLSGTVFARYYGLFINTNSITEYLYLGPTSTATQAKSIPVTAGSSFAISQGNGNLYFGPLTLFTSPSSTVTGTILWIEKAR